MYPDQLATLKTSEGCWQASVYQKRWKCSWMMRPQLAGILHRHDCRAQLASNWLCSCRYRMGEVLTAHKLLSSMSAGETVRGLKLSSRHSAAELLKGQAILTCSCCIPNVLHGSSQGKPGHHA